MTTVNKINTVTIDSSIIKSYVVEGALNKKIARTQSGFSMFDLVLWLAIAGGLLALIFGIYGPMATTAKAQKLLTELSTFQTKIREVYSGQATGYNGISDEEVIKSQAYPTNLSATTTTLSSNDAGVITITSTSDESFSIQYAGVPSNVCKSVVPKLVSAGGWSSLEVGGSQLWGGTLASPTKAQIDSACTGSVVAMTLVSN
jgi:type II secretory pathway pseudopilin PulG